ncbi:hypothetical protein [Cryobacterium zhongshanensis]|uniref:Uncharacterized protein n=1 Tax=Cryobacterium zhongshanensis TaxID=2928153 RepID=A0AA41QYA0_9MICO|nr:hypothetical protein [Cryobacterium zhongshanensis]MCI4659717.1 hypothetical protein [Cryobacterium zhongshanensis]
MSVQTLEKPLVAAAAATSSAPRVQLPGIYRGLDGAEFGLWRLRKDGIWLYCAPVFGAYWRRAADQNPGDKLIMLVDQTEV